MRFYEVWVRGIHHWLRFSTRRGERERLEAVGWRLVWDSAPSPFLGARYAAQQYNAPCPYDEGSAVAMGEAGSRSVDCDYCGGPLTVDEMTDYTALNVQDSACADCLRKMAEEHPHGKYLGT